MEKSFGFREDIAVGSYVLVETPESFKFKARIPILQANTKDSCKGLVVNLNWVVDSLIANALSSSLSC